MTFDPENGGTEDDRGLDKQPLTGQARAAAEQSAQAILARAEHQHVRPEDAPAAHGIPDDGPDAVDRGTHPTPPDHP